MAKINPFEFFQQVRNETSKVTWPSRRETLITTAMVFVFTVCAAVFFLVVDYVIRVGMTTILSLLR
jgi:preprotein translocase subunit SecE